MKSIHEVDPAWAWDTFAPSRERPWNRRLAAHLHRRAGFSASWKQLEETARLDPAAAAEKLVSESPETAEFNSLSDRMGRSLLAFSDPERLPPWWLYRMANTPDPLREKTTLFWHGHFATSAAKVEDAVLMLQHYHLLHEHGYGPFESMVQAISRDPAMLIWLDSTTNRKTHPNENYAREVMELFCLGEGNYTEKDIQELARTFTGWEVHHGRFKFMPHRHDYGVKSFLGSSGNYDGDDGIKVILQQPAAARFIAKKLLRFFVADEPELPAQLIEPIAQQLREENFVFPPVLKRILSSNLFYSEFAIGRKVRSPVELGVGLLVALEASTNLNQLDRGLADLGQRVFYPPNVKGWDGGRTWINSATLLGRANVVRKLLSHEDTKFGSAGGLVEVAEQYHISDAAGAVDWLSELLLARPLPQNTREMLIRSIQAQGGSAERKLRELVWLISTQPEFHLV